jgi:dimethylamine/trimethylamine dehydrogenase
MTLAHRMIEAKVFATFDEGFRASYEDELRGEGFFASLAALDPIPRRAEVWRKMLAIEQVTTQALLSAAQALGVASRDPQALRAEGAAEADDWRALGWHGALLVMRDEFPVYLTEFGGLLAQTPPAYAHLVDLLIRHEVAFIDFAKAELAGQADSMDVLDDYLVWARAT